MPISQKRLEAAVRQARALRSDRVEIHVSPETLRADPGAFNTIRAIAISDADQITVVADPQIPEWCVQCRNVEDRAGRKAWRIVNVRETEAESAYTVRSELAG